MLRECAMSHLELAGPGLFLSSFVIFCDIQATPSHVPGWFWARKIGVTSHTIYLRRFTWVPSFLLAVGSSSKHVSEDLGLILGAVV